MKSQVVVNKPIKWFQTSTNQLTDQSHNVYLYFQADQICYAVLCVFSYVAAGNETKDHYRKQT